MPSPPMGRLAWNCFNLLTGATSPPATGAAEAMRNMQDSSVKTKTSHLGYIVSVLATFRWRREGKEGGGPGTGPYG